MVKDLHRPQVPPKSFVLASGNAHKLLEFTALLAPHGIAVAAPPQGIACEETANSFAGNARLKVLATAAALRQANLPPAWILADDSGLAVDALAGAPGIFSARYAATVAQGDDQDLANRRKLLAAMAEVPLARRTARFVCALVAQAPAVESNVEASAVGATYEAHGTLEGWISQQERGQQGFGYDPIFVPQAEDKTACTGTLGELGPAVKDALSHRSRALLALLDQLRAR